MFDFLARNDHAYEEESGNDFGEKIDYVKEEKGIAYDIFENLDI